MAMFPVQGCVEGDFVVVLVRRRRHRPDERRGARRSPTTASASGWRHRTGRSRVRWQGDQSLDDDATIASLGCAPLDVLEVVYA